MLRLSHKKLDVWNKSILLVQEIYTITATYPPEEKFGLTSQMRRAAISISSNIAEGASRSSGKERKRFYEIARSSLVELDTQLEISLRLQYVTRKDLNLVDSLINEIFAMLTSMKANT